MMMGIRGVQKIMQIFEFVKLKTEKDRFVETRMRNSRMRNFA